jgi:Flp pilus assembly protein TadG
VTAEHPRLSDQRGAVGRVILTMLVLIVLFGIAAVETGSIIFTKLSLENTASDVAADAVLVLNGSHDPQQACTEAQSSLRDHDSAARLVRCIADPRLGEVKITLRKIATTIIVRHVSFLRKLGVVRATADTGPST